MAWRPLFHKKLRKYKLSTELQIGIHPSKPGLVYEIRKGKRLVGVKRLYDYTKDTEMGRDHLLVLKSFLEKEGRAPGVDQRRVKGHLGRIETFLSEGPGEFEDIKLALHEALGMKDGDTRDDLVMGLHERYSLLNRQAHDYESATARYVVGVKADVRRAKKASKAKRG